MKEISEEQCRWFKKYHYREAELINSCQLCAYAQKIDEDGKWGVEALECQAALEDTGKAFDVEFANICDLFQSEIMEEKPDW